MSRTYSRAFIFAATDTTSNATARILHLLATHPEVQEKLRKEVLGARAEHGDLMYSELVALPFLDAVVRETLRLYYHSTTHPIHILNTRPTATHLWPW